MSRFKIAHFIYLDGAGGGPRTVITHIACYCNNYDLTVFHGGCGTIVKACNALGVKHVHVPTETLKKTLWGGLVFAYHLRRLKPDLLILHGQWAGLVGSLAGYVVGIKRILYIAQWPAFYTDWDLYRVIRNYLTEKIPCSLASHVVTLADSNRYQYLMRRLIPENKLSKIPNTIDLVSIPTPESGDRLRQTLGWRPEHCHIVSVGRLADQKRVDWLLEAWALIHHRFPEARLWIIGGGPEEKSLHLLAKKLHITETCTFLGPQNNGIRFINASDIVVMTTVYEAFGNIAIESMACGKPILANDVDGVRDTFTHGVEGYYVPPYEPKTLADYLAKLIKEPALRAKMGKAGLQSVKHYDVTAVFGRYLELIERLLKS